MAEKKPQQQKNGPGPAGRMKFEKPKNTKKTLTRLLSYVTQKKALLIIVFILVIVILQQLDGNLIGPKILGNSTGLSAFWVIFAILLGSGLFGFPGMIFGVPTFAVIYHILTKSVNERLKRKNLPVETEQYVSVHSIEKKQLLYVKSENNERETEEDKKKMPNPIDEEEFVENFDKMFNE